MDRRRFLAVTGGAVAVLAAGGVATSRGSRAPVPDPTGHLVTRWGTDPFRARVLLVPAGRCLAARSSDPHDRRRPAPVAGGRAHTRGLAGHDPRCPPERSPCGRPGDRGGGRPASSGRRHRGRSRRSGVRATPPRRRSRRRGAGGTASDRWPHHHRLDARRPDRPRRGMDPRDRREPDRRARPGHRRLVARLGPGEFHDPRPDGRPPLVRRGDRGRATRRPGAPLARDSWTTIATALSRSGPTPGWRTSDRLDDCSWTSNCAAGPSTSSAVRSTDSRPGSTTRVWRCA